MGLFSRKKAITMYESNELPLALSHDETKALFIEARKGNKDARAKLIVHNLRLVVLIASRYSYYNNQIDDLESIGTIGLIKAVDYFDLGKGYLFSTYASVSINNEIRMYFRENKKTASNISLDDPVGVDNEGQELKIEDILYSDESDIVEQIYTKDEYLKLRAILNELDPLKKAIIEQHYGFNCNCKTLQKIGQEYGFSRQTISRNARAAKLKIKRHIKHFT
jgi:RNA polymerase sporulation-specific sigma factor